MFLQCSSNIPPIFLLASSQLSPPTSTSNRCFDQKGEGDALVANPKTLAFWVATRDTPQHAAPRSVRGFCMRMIDLVLFMQQR